MQSQTLVLDRLMRRILFIQPQTAAPPAADGTQTAERAFGLSLLFSGVRCVLQYAVLPFLLPLIGITASAAVPLLVVISVLAVISIFFSLRRFWKVNYRYKWQYLGVALAAILILIVFIVVDVSAMMHG